MFTCHNSDRSPFVNTIAFASTLKLYSEYMRPRGLAQQIANPSLAQSAELKME